MTDPTPIGTGHRPPSFATEAGAVDELLRAVRCVIFDFDGPVCSVFAGWPAPDVATAMINWLAGQGIELYPDVKPSDPLEVLRDAGRKLPTEVVSALEVQLTCHEISAAETSQPTPGAVQAIKSLSSTGRTLAVASNNDAKAIERYLGDKTLAGYFHGGVHGRSTDPALLKPDPDCVRRALHSAGAEPSAALMVGDSASDFEAASRVGVTFLGFAVDRRHAVSLLSAGATTVIPSWDPVISAVMGSAHAR